MKRFRILFYAVPIALEHSVYEWNKFRKLPQEDGKKLSVLGYSTKLVL